MSQQTEKREYIKRKICVNCEKWLRSYKGQYDYYNDYLALENGDLLCLQCDETDTEDPTIEIKIFTGKGSELYDDYDLIQFGYHRIHYIDCYEYEGDFKESSHFNGYRGYYDVESSKWSEIALVNVRTFDPEMDKLEEPTKVFTDRLIDTIGKYALVQARTSNCMVVNMSIWVKNEDREKALEIKEQIIKEFDLNEDDL